MPSSDLQLSNLFTSIHKEYNVVDKLSKIQETNKTQNILHEFKVDFS